MTQEIKRIGWIGTGVMGVPMAGHLIEAGYALSVHNRTKAKARSLIDRGAVWVDSPADAARGVDVVMTMVGFPADVEETHLSPAGTLSADPPPRYLIDMTTTKPSLAVEIHRRANVKGIASVDAPVSGGDVGAQRAKLSIMVGGEPDAVEAVTPILRHLGSTVVHQGGPGSGQHTKMVNQVLIATNMIGCCEGLLYAQRAGLDPLTVIESVGSGAAGSWSINVLGPRMIKRDFDPGFFVDHFIKDLAIALDEAERMDLALPGLTLARQLYQSVQNLGHGHLGTQALLLALEAINKKT